MKMKRVFLIVLDSVGAGELPDAAEFGDVGAHTLKSCYNTGRLKLPNLISMGLGNIEGLDFLGRTENPTAAYGRCAEKSRGKDTTVGHWEIAGVISQKPLPTYPDGFPAPLIKEFERLTGRGVICNKTYSGTEVIKDYGDESVRNGKLIVYTSADSVFQIAAHEDVVPLSELYEICKTARKLLCGDNAVGRVIARPFTKVNGSYKRTSNRRDFSLAAPASTLLDAIDASGLDSIAVGKISDIFANRGVTESIHTVGNTDGIAKTAELLERDFSGLCFVNLVDFDMLYGHRNDAVGYAEALNEFDRALPEYMSKLRDGDMMIITADHGCDPGDISTDHTREYVPLLLYGKQVSPVSLGTRTSFCDTADAIAEALGVKFSAGTSYFGDICR